MAEPFDFMLYVPVRECYVYNTDKYILHMMISFFLYLIIL